MLPSHRCYVAIELPFTLSPTTTITKEEEKEHIKDNVVCGPHGPITAFLPPAQLQPCLVEHDTNTSTVNESDNSNDGDERKEEEGGDEEDGEEDEEEGEEGKEKKSNSDDEEETTLRGGNTAAPTLKLRTCDGREYNAEQIFRTWCGTDWGIKASTSSNGYTSSSSVTDEKERLQQARRRELFPSMVPQLLLHGYYRNDLLVRVTRRRRLRRWRDPVTGVIVHEEEEMTVPASEDAKEANDAQRHNQQQQQDNVDSSNKSQSDENIRACVVGVVAREVQLARPADWTFALPLSFTSPAPPITITTTIVDALLTHDVFPPTHFLSARTPYEVRYALGHERNTAVRPELDPSVTTAVTEANTVNNNNNNNTSGDETTAEWTALPSLVVAPDAVVLPPSPLPAHRAFLRRVGSSLDGRAPSDPPEVRVLSALLRRRPVWMTKDLAEAQLESGLCPRPYHNKQLMTCLTYVITAGAFNRLRIRLDYDPYRNSDSVIYQRLSVRLVRRTELGVLLRDASRSPHVDAAVKIILSRHRPHCDEYKQQQRRVRAEASAGGDVYDGAEVGTLIELLCRVVQRGSLFIPFQLVDVLDDAVFADIVARVPTTTSASSPMPMAQRQSRSGWLSETAYHRVTTHFTDALQAFLCDEVIPLLRHFAASADSVAMTPSPNATQVASRAVRPDVDDAQSARASESSDIDSTQVSVASSSAPSSDDSMETDSTGGSNDI